MKIRGKFIWLCVSTLLGLGLLSGSVLSASSSWARVLQTNKAEQNIKGDAQTSGDWVTDIVTGGISQDGLRLYLPAVSLNEDFNSFTFAVTSDIHQFAGSGEYDNSSYFRGAVEAIADHSLSAFMVTAGDMDPPANVLWTVDQVLGSSYRWYPLVGNHDTDSAAYTQWLRAFDYGTVQPGPFGCPKTTYSFDYGNTHFVMLNVYCDLAGEDATYGDIPDHLYNWLVTDLQATQKEHILVFGHEPAYPLPDVDTGRVRHEGDSLDADPVHRDRFWNLLVSEGVTAYICGHTHNYSLENFNGVWQLNEGITSGLGDVEVPGTFSLIHIDGPVVTYETYRDDMNGGPYTLRYQGFLDSGQTIYQPKMSQ